MALLKRYLCNNLGWAKLIFVWVGVLCQLSPLFQGRLIDHIKDKMTNLERVTFLVFDEADRMFDMGFGKHGYTR